MDLSEKAKPRHDRDRSSEARVLIIRHDQHADEDLERELTSLRCAFDHAAGGVDALHRLRDTPYAVVVTDPETHIHEHLALIDEIQRVRPGVRVIRLAQTGTPEDLIAALRLRVLFCLSAPFDVKGIARCVISAMEARDSSAGIEVLSADREWISVRMNCDMSNADRLTAFFKQFQMSLPECPPEEMMIAFEEMLHNTSEHGANNDPSMVIDVAAVRTARAFVYYIADPGKGFRTDAIPHAAASASP